jgi:hypothetical protein
VMTREDTENLIASWRANHSTSIFPAADALARGVGGSRVACPREGHWGLRIELVARL